MSDRVEPTLRPDLIRHVFDSKGRHCIEINGFRGYWAAYDGMATHPAGYAAVSDYYAGPDKEEARRLFDRGLRDIVPEAGMVWKIEQVEHECGQTVPDGWYKEGGSDEDSLTMEQSFQYFAEMNRQYEKEFPLASILRELHAEYVAAHPEEYKDIKVLEEDGDVSIISGA